MVFRLIETEKKGADENMATDTALLDTLSEPLLHLYDWKGPSGTYGHFVKPREFLKMEGVRKRGLDLAKRPTGGGIVFHTSDYAFSVLLPSSDPAFSESPLSNYAFVNERVKWVVREFLKREPSLLFQEDGISEESIARFCMAKPTKYDVMIEGKKVAGAAQRKTSKGFLHQGTIFLGMMEDDFYHDVLLNNQTVLSEMKQNSFPLLGPIWNEEDLKMAREDISALLKRAFKC